MNRKTDRIVRARTMVIMLQIATYRCPLSFLTSDLTCLSCWLIRLNRSVTTCLRVLSCRLR